MNRNWWIYILPIAIIVAIGCCVYWFDPVYAFALPLVLLLGRFLTRHARNKIFWFLLRPLTPAAWRSWLRRLMQWRMQSIRKWYLLPLWMRIATAMPVFLLSCYVLLTANEYRDLFAIVPAHFSADLLFGEWVRTMVVPYAVRWAAARGLDHMAYALLNIVPESVRRKVAGHASLVAWRATHRLARIRHSINERRARAAHERSEPNKIIQK